MRIAIMGCGHMGGWLAGQLCKENELAVFDRDAEKARTVSSCGQALASLEQLSSFKPGLLLNCVSLEKTQAAFEAALPFLPPACALGDVASIKGALPEFYKKTGRPFVSLHPMFGPTFTDMRMLKEENAIAISESDPALGDLFESFFRRLGLNFLRMSFAEHDQMMAYSLALPFASTLVFGACMKEKTVPGSTFKKHLAIAQGLMSEDDHLLSEILFNPSALGQLEAVTNRLEFLKHIVKNRDQEEAKRFFDKIRKQIGE